MDQARPPQTFAATAPDKPTMIAMTNHLSYSAPQSSSTEAAQ